ncbi:HAD family hydrolase [bacterium]|nr:HAD family hydrolase [bacterium]
MSLLIFDCDGVLVDSEWLVARVEVETRAEFGQQISIEEYIRRYVGMSTRSDEYLNSFAGLPANFRDILKPRVARALHEELDAIPGVAETLARLNGTPKAIASSSLPEEIEMMLKRTQLFHHFEDRIFSVSMVGKPKPAPDIYIHVAQHFGVVEEKCLVIEDSVVGATAALSAGMTVWGFTGGRHIAPDTPERLRNLGCQLVFKDMLELPNLLRIHIS